MKMYNFTDKGLDIFTAILIFIASFIFYYLGCKELLTAGFYQQINIAFDLDQSHFFYSVAHDIDTERLLLIKHPFIYLYNYVIHALRLVGVSDNIAVIGLAQCFHSGSLVVSYYVFRTIGRTTLESGFLTFGLAGTSTYISTGLVLDVYSLSIFWISAIFLVICKAEYQKQTGSIWLRSLISIMAIGTTSYLIVLVILMELSLEKKEGIKFYNIFSSKLFYQQLFRIAVIGLMIFIIIYFQVIIEISQDPIGVLKRIFWTVNRPGDKEGIVQVISVFSLFSILSPKVTSILLPEGITMIDLRDMDFSFLGWFIIILLTLSIVFKFKNNNKNHCFLWLICLFWLAFNVIFHTIYQYRGSLFLYTGHFILSVWIIYFTPVKIFSDNIKWQQEIFNKFDILFVYILPFLIWGNNIYLYEKIQEIM